MSKLDKEKERLGIFKMIFALLVGIVLSVSSFVINTIRDNNFDIFSLLGVIVIGLSIISMILKLINGFLPLNFVQIVVQIAVKNLFI